MSCVLNQSHSVTPNFESEQCKRSLLQCLVTSHNASGKMSFIQMKQNFSISGKAHQICSQKGKNAFKRKKQSTSMTETQLICRVSLCVWQRFPLICARHNKVYQGSLEWHIKVWALFLIVPLNTLSKHSQDVKNLYSNDCCLSYSYILFIFWFVRWFVEMCL